MKKSKFVIYKTNPVNIKEVLTCNICLSGKPHSKCFSTYCIFCFEVFKKDFISHCESYHKEFFCKECNKLFLNINDHICLK
jgi:hypothetical protein